MDLQLAPTKPEEEDDDDDEGGEASAVCDMLSAQCDLGHALVEAVRAENRTAAWPSKDAIERCLTCLRDHAPHVRVATDLLEEYLYEFEGERASVKANLLVAIVASGMKPIALETTSHDINQINEAMKSLDYNLNSCIRYVQKLSLKETHRTTDSRRLICGFLESATELRDLKLHFYDSIRPSPSTPVSKLLSASNVSQLQVLAVVDLIIEGADLLTVLSCCRSTLLKITMRCVFILGKDNVWGKVFDILTSMPR